MKCLRIEARVYNRNKTGEITRAYSGAMDKRMGERLRRGMYYGA